MVLHGRLYRKKVSLDAVPRSIDLSEDGERLVVGLDNYNIIEFDAINLNSIMIYQGVNGFIEGLKYVNGHEHFVSVSKDRFARLWHSGENEFKVIYKCEKNCSLFAVDYDCKKNSVYISEGNIIIELDGQNFEEIHRFEGHTSVVVTICIDFVKRKMLTGSNDGKVREWNLDLYSSKEIQAHNNRISGIVYCGEHIITSSFDGTIGVWDNAKKGRLLWKSMAYGRINIAGCTFNKCTYVGDEAEAVIIENGGITIT
uniref:Uncharacterized protein n=1 Tax=Eubacterium plexicaudatum ASF492 TaxID=1235802 RepID=N1ZZY2_9FIRM